MASERRHDEAESEQPDLSQPPFPLPPGWVFHPRDPNASVENILKLAGIFHHNGPIVLGDMFDDDDAGVSDEVWQSWQRENSDASE